MSGKVGEIWVALGADNKKLKKGMKESQDIVQSTLDALSNMKAELASLAAVSLPVMEAKNWAVAVNDIVDKTNMAGESASKLLAIGEFFGLAASDMGDALTKMSKTAFEATIAIDKANAAGERSDDAFTQFGIAIRDTNGQLLSAEEIFKNTVNVHRDMANGLEKTAMEMKIFGRSGAKLNDILNVTDDEMQRVTDAAQKSGLIISTETSQAWEEFDKSTNLAKLQMKGFAVTLGNEMMPEVEKLLEGLGDAVEWFSNLDTETKKNITTALELAAAISAIKIAGRGLMTVLSPMAKVAGFALSGTGMIAAAASATIYKGYKDYQHAKNGGEFEFDELGNVRRIEDDAAPDSQVATPITKDKKNDNQNNGNGKDNRAPTQTKGMKEKDDSKKIAREIAAINKELDQARAKVTELSIAYSKMQQDIAYASIEGGLQIYAGIAKEGAARTQMLDDHLKRVDDNVASAERIRARAVESGNAEEMRKTQEHLDAMQAMRTATEQSIGEEKKQIDKQTQSDLLKESTAKAAMEKQLETALREANYQEYLTYLELYKSADAQAFLERQEALEYQHQWQMESMENMSTKILETADMFKNGFANAVGQAAIGTKKFGESIKDLGKQIVAMWVTWMVQRAIAGAFAKVQDKKALAEQTAFGTAALAALAPAAAAKLILDPGAAGVAAAAYAALVGGMITVGSLAGGGETTGGGEGLKIAMPTSDRLSKDMGGYGKIFELQQLATGGVTSGATIAMIGEGKYQEAVLPLDLNIFKDMYTRIFGNNGAASGDNISISMNNYGDINTGADYDTYKSDMISSIAAGMRGR